jgi:hypothetical protein
LITGKNVIRRISTMKDEITINGLMDLSDRL